MGRIFCISSGQLSLKKIDNVINRRNRYLNYGLLSLASELKRNGFDTIQIQGDFDEPQDIYNVCVENGLLKSEYPILISIPSFYAISWANKFISILKSEASSIKIIVGGRWVVNNSPDSLRNIIPKADFIIPGLANNIITSIVRASLVGGKLEPQGQDVKSIPTLDYSILFNRKLYQPSVEISRGCGMGCSFCQENTEKLLPLKSPTILVDEVKKTLLTDELNIMSAYFEASMFVPNAKWCEQLLMTKSKLAIDFKWRAEGRVDVISSALLQELAKSGLKILDLGLESASPKQLLRMRKTKNPNVYLSKASELIKEAFKKNIWVKINVLLTAGETMSSFDETVDWLEKHKKYIKGASVGPVIIFGLPEVSSWYLHEISKYGATKSHSPEDGITHINLSKEIDYTRSVELSLDLSKMLMNSNDYYDLKSFSYFSRDYTYKNFIYDLKSCNSPLSFTVNELKN